MRLSAPELDSGELSRCKNFVLGLSSTSLSEADKFAQNNSSCFNSVEKSRPHRFVKTFDLTLISGDETELFSDFLLLFDFLRKLDTTRLNIFYSQR